MGNQFILEMKNISKSFSGVKVLDSVDLQIKAGEVRALVGENGAGKSTLMKILGGILSKDTGEILIRGERKEIENVDEAKHNGIALIHQEISLVQALSIAENIFLGREPMNKGGLVDFKKIYKDTKEVMDTIGLQLDPHTLVQDLSISQQQMVEICRALASRAKILVMDEPTASLTDKEVGHLFQQIKRLKQSGVAIIYISHKMDEIFEISDSISILRDGRHIVTTKTEETEYKEVIRHMVGRDLNSFYAERIEKTGEKILEVKGLTNANVKDISFTLNKGEILGFAGLVGAGRTELVRAIFGIDPIRKGEILLNGQPTLIKSPRDAIRNGIVLVPEDRKGNGLFLSNTIQFNMTIAVLNQFIHFLANNKRGEKRMVEGYSKKLSIKMNSEKQLALELSGGNQQKIVISKWLAANPRILIMDEPTRGIDVGAKSEIYHLMDQLASEGVSIIMISSELPEILSLSTRIAVMHEGALVKIFDTRTETVDQQDIMYYATGGYRYGKTERSA